MNKIEQYNKIAVIGFGVSGQSIAQYALKHDIQVDVYEDKNSFEFDQSILAPYFVNKNFKLFFKDSEKTSQISEYDLIIASPGVPLTHELVVQAQSKNIECITDINLFIRIFREKYKNGKIISVTGSNGKSTTVSLMYEVLKSAGEDVYLGGNIGTSPLDFLDDIQGENPVVIIETSSYQLEYMTGKDYFDIACILNLSDNHLNRYGGSKQLYAKAKLGGIDFDYTTVLVNLDDEYTCTYILPQLKSKDVLAVQFESVNASSVITFENNMIMYKGDVDQVYISDTTQMKLPGLHNVYNAAFVCGVLHVLEIKPSESIENSAYLFGGLKHRIQHVDTINQITYINDSKSTSPDATSKAITSLNLSDKNIVLISGGNDKDISYEAMKEGWQQNVKGLILLPGTANAKLKKLAQETGVEIIAEVQTMQDAFDSIQSCATEGDIVLLSPATDSHATFKSFEDRGNQFIQCVQNLKN